MANTASSAYIEYGYEATFGETLTQWPSLFGKEQKGNGFEFTNNQIPLGQLYSPEIECFVYGLNEGKISMEYVLANPWPLTSIFTQPVTTGSDPAFIHTWTSDPDVNANIRQIVSLGLNIGFIGKDGNVVRTIKGVVAPSLSFRMTLGEPIRMTQELIWGQDSVDTTIDPGIGTLGDFVPYTFAHASIELPDGTPVATIQNFDLDLKSNATLLRQLGTPDSVDAYRKILEMTGKLNLTVLDKTNIERVFAREELATMKVSLIQQNKSSNDQNIVMNFVGVGLSTHNNEGFEPGELVLENIDFQCRSVTIVATNDTETPP